MSTLANVIRRAYELLVTGANLLQSPLLLALRIYFFWQLFLTGKAKLTNIGKVIDFLYQPRCSGAKPERLYG
jgi:uncharacterized membrane protein YphA (DoxX/SURF4 family)